ncbi:5-amino-6-(5-phospho-D-ribitylamino)uracil phosphatase YigB [Vibrio maerlii]|uniref:5-amino-6-(5-phospho-D-ribitylamino)uracil phosphatase YigB n=1 Tax=Vibrio maerlii TaxID=2231648 RepID=UPI000E3C4516|nr:5-amino-6-(5-phospho-D-ribitylamino)uracil phosphatase YigB [Vibrio maerlii]
MKYYRPWQQIQALTFDLDDTLYDNHPVIMRVESEMAKWLFTQHPVAQQWSIQQWAGLKRELATLQPDLVHDVTRWRQQQIEQGLIHLGYSQPQAEQASYEGMTHAMSLRNQVDVPRETHQVMSILAEKLPLVAITNGNVDVEKIGLADYFKAIYRAGPDGRSKPYSDMFDKAADALSVHPSEILHIGDHLISDVHGANLAGFRSCWINLTGCTIKHRSKSRSLPNIEITQLEQLLNLV